VSEYDQDGYAWAMAQAEALRRQQWDALDLDHLAEEIAGVGHSQCHGATRHLRVLLLYLLKWEYQPDQRSKRWLRRMDQAQAELESYLWQSPSLQAQLPTLLARAYLQACRLAARETGLPPPRFRSRVPGRRSTWWTRKSCPTSWAEEKPRFRIGWTAARTLMAPSSLPAARPRRETARPRSSPGSMIPTTPR
jgi:Domain of unknown function DUF29